MDGQHITITGPFAFAVEKVTAALKNEDFGVLSDIDIQKAMKEKLPVLNSRSAPPYRSLINDCSWPGKRQSRQSGIPVRQIDFPKADIDHDLSTVPPADWNAAFTVGEQRRLFGISFTRVDRQVNRRSWRSTTFPFQ